MLTICRKYLLILSTPMLVTPLWAATNSCDAVLIPQIESQNDNLQFKLSWLSLIDVQSYEQAKKSASMFAGIPGISFDGDYDSFDESRKKLFKEESFTMNMDQSREVYKSFLSPEQLAAWRECKTGKTELAYYYANVEKEGATLILEWQPPAAVGKLRSIKASFKNGKPDDALKNISANGLYGTSAFIVTRESEDKAISGTVSGKAGVNDTNYAAYIYVPVIKEITDRPPSHLVVSQIGQVHKSIAYYGGQKMLVSGAWDCVSIPAGFDLVIGAEHPVYLGKKLGKCAVRAAPGGTNCDSAGEGCVDVFIDKGCLVNKEWHGWYKEVIAKQGIGYSAESVCDATH